MTDTHHTHHIHCFVCHQKGAQQLWYEYEAETNRPFMGMACDLCMCFRDNDTLAEFTSVGKKKSQNNNNKCYTNSIKLSKRAFDNKRRDMKRGCKKKDLITTADLKKFLEENPTCFYCGGCSSNIDRDSVKDCYKDVLERQPVPSCYKCNRRRRDKPREVFLEHMERVAASSAS